MITPLSVLIVAGLVSDVGPESWPPASLTLDEVTAGLTKLDEAFNKKDASYKIRYAQEKLYYNDKLKIDHGADATVEAEFAHRNGKLYVEYKEANNATFDKSKQPDRAVWDGTVCSWRNGSVVTIFNYVIPQCYRYEAYLTNLYVNPWRDMPPADNPTEEFYEELPAMVVENKARYSMRQRQEQIDGAWCHVLEWPGFDTIWVDTNHSFVARQRHSKIKEHLISVKWNRKLTERRPGLWLPSEQEEIQYALPFTLTDVPVGKPLVRVVTRLSDIQFDPLPDSFFSVPIRSTETLTIQDSVRNMSYEKFPEGQDPLKNALQAIEPYKHRSRPIILWLCNGIVLGLVLMFYLVHNRVRADQSAPDTGAEAQD